LKNEELACCSASPRSALKQRRCSGSLESLRLDDAGFSGAITGTEVVAVEVGVCGAQLLGTEARAGVADGTAGCPSQGSVIEFRGVGIYLGLPKIRFDRHPLIHV
jgi:hypothetical protein